MDKSDDGRGRWVDSPEGLRAGFWGLFLLLAGLWAVYGRPYWVAIGEWVLTTLGRVFGAGG